MRRLDKVICVICTCLLAMQVNGQDEEVAYSSSMKNWKAESDTNRFPFELNFNGIPQKCELTLVKTDGQWQEIILTASPGIAYWGKESTLHFNGLYELSGEIYATEGDDIIRLKLQEDLVELKQYQHYAEQTSDNAVWNFKRVSKLQDQPTESELDEQELIRKEKQKLLAIANSAPDTTAAAVTHSASNHTPPSDKTIQTNDTLFHTVAAGENLYRIGLKYDKKTAEIMALNNMETAAISVGQRLIVGVQPAVKSEPKPEPSTSTIVEDQKMKVEADSTIQHDTDSAELDHYANDLEPTKSSIEQQDKPTTKKEVTALAEPTPFTEDPNKVQSILPKDTAKLAELGVELVSTLMSPTQRDSLYLKEYFFATIDPSGKVLEVEDQRTETNRNTKYLTHDQISQFRTIHFELDSTPQPIKVGWSYQLVAKRTHYNLKITDDNIRLYNIPLYFEYLEPSHPHYQLIMEEFKSSGKSHGKYQVTVVDAEVICAIMGRKEYNPFATLLKELFNQKTTQVESLVSSQ